ncbi:MAG: gfo/Idh/MocA family oxidoreductase [Chloroflexi bacterium]|nr:MAG: gfo/Idh/MocA family oxidoreductase [Chloroflexota bacterium]
MTANLTRIGILSAAHGHVHSYLACLRNRRDVTVVGLYDDDLDRGRQAADGHKIEFFASADELLDQQLDGVVVCAENAKHRPMVEQATGRVGAILCEKPIATTVADAQAMIDTCARTGARLQIAFPVRFAPPIQWLKTKLDEGLLGAVYAVQTTNHGGTPGRWFIDRQLAGGGAVMDHTVHVIDLLRWFWQTEVTEVYAEIGDSVLHPGLGIDDVGLLSFTLANGVYGTLDTSWSRPSSYPTWGDVKIEVTGENGVLYVDTFRQHLAISSEKHGKTYWHPWGSDMNQGLIDDFVSMIQRGRSPSITGEDGLRALEVTLAAYRSAEAGEPVAVRSSDSRS